MLTIACPKCEGEKEIQCPACRGLGEWFGFVCARCIARGEIDCPRCKGKGIVRKPGHATPPRRGQD
jgi:hypothetical protein